MTCEPTPSQRAAAVRTVASAADSADDLATLLEMLGLDAAEARHPRAVPATGPRAPGDHIHSHSELNTKLDMLYHDAR